MAIVLMGSAGYGFGGAEHKHNGKRPVIALRGGGGGGEGGGGGGGGSGGNGGRGCGGRGSGGGGGGGVGGGGAGAVGGVVEPRTAKYGSTGNFGPDEKGDGEDSGKETSTSVTVRLIGTGVSKLKHDGYGNNGNDDSNGNGNSPARGSLAAAGPASAAAATGGAAAAGTPTWLFLARLYGAALVMMLLTAPPVLHLLATLLRHSGGYQQRLAGGTSSV